MSSSEASRTTTETTRAKLREEPARVDDVDDGDDVDEAERRRRMRNNVRKLREDRLLSKAELARRAGVSPLTIDRIESGKPCRMDTKRKIILALGMTIEEKDRVFLKEEGDADESPQAG